MKIINEKELRQSGAVFDEAEILPESWMTRKGFYAYEHSPRPKSALFFTCSELLVTFIPSEGESITARRGDVIYIPEGALYRVVVEGGSRGEIETYTVNFKIRAGGENCLLGEKIRRVAAMASDVARTHCESLYRALNPAEGELPDRLKAAAELYFIADSAFSFGEEQEIYYAIRTGVEALRQEWNKNERIEKYADICGISAAHFYNCFRESFGKSPVEYRNSLRLSNAETMLKSTDMRIGEIAQAVGYEDPFYFCRVFTKKNGLSPKKYREKFSRDI